MSNAKLKPCPFCGSDIVNIDIVYGWGIKDHYEAACRNCGASTSNTPDREEAAMYWNRRAKSPKANIRKAKASK